MFFIDVWLALCLCDATSFFVCVCAFVCMRQEAHLQKDISNVLLAQGGRHTSNKDCVSLHSQLKKAALSRNWSCCWVCFACCGAFAIWDVTFGRNWTHPLAFGVLGLLDALHSVFLRVHLCILGSWIFGTCFACHSSHQVPTAPFFLCLSCFHLLFLDCFI